MDLLLDEQGKPDLTTFAGRLRFAMHEAKLTNQSALARAIGVKPQAIQHLADPGKNAAGSSHVAALASALHVSSEWLASGKGPMTGNGATLSLPPLQASGSITPVAPAPQVLQLVQPDPSGDLTIPEYDTGGKMGNGGLVLKDQPGMIRSWRVSSDWVAKNIHNVTSIKNLAIVTGFGDSMRPLYNPGDPLLVDTGVVTVDFDGIYFFRVDGEGFVKRLQRIPGQGILVISENSSYRDWTLKPEQMGDQFQVFGRVVKVWRGTDF